MKLNKKEIIILAGLLLFIIIDQLSKVLVINGIITFDNVIRFSEVQNTGVAFGLFNGNVFTIILLNIFLIGMIIRFIFLYKERMRNLMFIALLFIVSGGISNLIDRIFRGHVVDFIDINKLISFPVFNLADIVLTVGWITLIICVIMDFRGEKSGIQNK